MPFDLATAKPVGTFDLTSAKPVEQQSQSDESNLPWYNKTIPIIGKPLISKEGALADLKRGTGLGLRAVSDAATGIPLAAADAGITLRNAITGENNQMASQMWNQDLNNLGIPEPQGKLEKGASLATTILAGLKLPSPTASNPAPSNYSKVAPTNISTLLKSQKEGYVVPPSTTNPTVMNKLLESTGGKIATAQDAAAKNADVTNALVKAEFGIHPDAPLTEATFKAIRDEAAPAYEAIKKVGTMATDDTYRAALNKISEKFQGASKSFPGLENDQVTKLVQSLDQPSFDSNAAIDATKILRENASKAYAQGDSVLGKAYKSASAALEDVIERNLSNAGEKGAKLLEDFRNARQTIAKAYSAEKAFNPSTGNVVATKLGQQLSKGKPLSGNLETIAQFGQAFPKAAQAITDSGAVRNTDVMIGAGTSALSHEPQWLLYPFGRMAARSLLLSSMGQKLAVPSQPADLSAPTNATVQAIAKLMSQ